MSYPFQYMVLFSPSEEVKQDIVAFKHQFRSSYGHFESEYSIPHITVGHVLLPLSMEDLIFTSLAEQVSRIESFRFEINGFYHFPDSRTIYAQLEDHGGFSSITQSFKEVMEQYHLQKSSYHVADTPHLTIAKQLDRKTFNKAYCFEYSFKQYHRSFEACALTILRRSDADRPFELFRTLPLKDDVAYPWFGVSEGLAVAGLRG